jgi:D-lactate dehydrogenase (cytochrome)
MSATGYGGRGMMPYWARLALKAGSSGHRHRRDRADSRASPRPCWARQEDIRESGLTAPIVGHVGDGNFHTVILVPPEPDGRWSGRGSSTRRSVARALALGGSCSGEHGVGLGKREFLELEHGAETLAVMRSVKATLDPRGILESGQDVPELRRFFYRKGRPLPSQLA